MFLSWCVYSVLFQVILLATGAKMYLTQITPPSSLPHNDDTVYIFALCDKGIDAGACINLEAVRDILDNGMLIGARQLMGVTT